MPKVVFWILLILWAVGGFWGPADPAAQTNWGRGNRAVQIILFGILGYYLMGF